MNYWKLLRNSWRVIKDFLKIIEELFKNREIDNYPVFFVLFQTWPTVKLGDQYGIAIILQYIIYITW